VTTLMQNLLVVLEIGVVRSIIRDVLFFQSAKRGRGPTGVLAEALALSRIDKAEGVICRGDQTARR
jgi:hypothetical protein